MEFKINYLEFNKAVLEVGRAITYKDSLPILTGIKVEAKMDHLILIGRNSHIAIKKVIPVSDKLSILQTGSIVVSAKYLEQIIKRLPNNDIHFMVNENQSVTIKSNEITTKLNGLDDKEYPPLSESNSGSSLRIATEKLISTIRKTVFAAAKAGTNPSLTGVNFLFEDDFLTCIATNSQRLSCKRLTVDSNINGSFIVPRHTLNEFDKLFGSYKTEIDVSTTQTGIIFKSSTLSLYSKLIMGNYPNVTSLISQDFGTKFVLNTKQLLRGIERASIFAKEMKNNIIKLKIEDEFSINISSGSSEIGQIEEKQPIKFITGVKDLTISFDGNFIMEALKAINEEEVRLCFEGSLKPILLVPEGDNSHLQLVSPARTRH